MKQKGAKYMAQVNAIIEKYPNDNRTSSTNTFRVKSANGEAPLLKKSEVMALASHNDGAKAPFPKEVATPTTPSFVNNILNMFRK